MNNVNTKMNYFEIFFENDDSFAFRGMIEEMSVSQAKNFLAQIPDGETYQKLGKVKRVVKISFEEMMQFFGKKEVEQWSIAVTNTDLAKLYEAYQTQWMIDHGFTIKNLIEELITYDYDTGNEFSFAVLYEEWLKNCGFGSQIWACFDEWKENEGKAYIDIDKPCGTVLKNKDGEWFKIFQTDGNKFDALKVGKKQRVIHGCLFDGDYYQIIQGEIVEKLEVINN